MILSLTEFFTPLIKIKSNNSSKTKRCDTSQELEWVRRRVLFAAVYFMLLKINFVIQSFAISPLWILNELKVSHLTSDCLSITQTARSTIMVIIFWGFFIFDQMFLSPQERQSVIISNEDSISKVPHELVAKRLKTQYLRKLGNVKKISKCPKSIA